MTEILYQILLVVGIVVGVFLCFNLWRLYKILDRVQEVVDVTRDQVIELNSHLNNIEKFLSGLTETIKGFLMSFDFIKTVKDKFIKNDKEKEKND